MHKFTKSNSFHCFLPNKLLARSTRPFNILCRMDAATCISKVVNDKDKQFTYYKERRLRSFICLCNKTGGFNFISEACTCVCFHFSGCLGRHLQGEVMCGSVGQTKLTANCFQEQFLPGYILSHFFLKKKQLALLLHVIDAGTVITVQNVLCANIKKS